MTHKYRSQRRLDLFSLALLLIGIASGLGAYALIEQGINALVMIPSVVAATIGATHLVKYEAPRD